MLAKDKLATMPVLPLLVFGAGLFSVIPLCRTHCQVSESFSLISSRHSWRVIYGGKRRIGSFRCCSCPQTVRSAGDSPAPTSWALHRGERRLNEATRRHWLRIIHRTVTPRALAMWLSSRSSCWGRFYCISSLSLGYRAYAIRRCTRRNNNLPA